MNTVSRLYAEDSNILSWYLMQIESDVLEVASLEVRAHKQYSLFLMLNVPHWGEGGFVH
jgi:hypothetical protein